MIAEGAGGYPAPVPLHVPHTKEQDMPKPKIEIRSLTGADYSRAGGRWSPQWTALDVSQFSRQQLEELRADPHLEFRADGKRIRGGAEESEAVDDDGALGRDELVERLRETADELREQNNELKSKVDGLEKQRAAAEYKLDELTKELAKTTAEKNALAAKLTGLTAAKPAAPTETAAKPPAPPAPTDTPPAPTAPATEPAKGSKAKG